MPPAPAPLPRQWAIKESDVEIGRLIAQGGFGQVLEGMWLGHTKVAVKRLLIKPGRDVMSDIEREVTAWSALRHPNVLPFFGACVEAPLPWMISPFMERGNVLHYLSTFEDGPGDDLRLSLIYDISKGMQYLHSQKVIHSDLKSVNVLVSNDGAALVTDFGFVRVRSKTRSTLSKNMNVPGTFQWMPPERHRDGTCDEKGDVYAFAMMCVEIWTLDVPFGTIPDSPFLYHRIVNEGFRPDLSSIDMPEALKSLLRECWDQRPEARPTFSAIAERLKAIVPPASAALPQPVVARAAEPQAVEARGVSPETMPPPYQTMADSSSTPPRAAPAGRREDLAEAKRLYERALLEIPTEYPARRWYSAIPLLQQSCELGSPEAKALLAYAIFQEHGGLNYTSAPFRSEEEWNRYVLHGLIKRLDDMDNMTPAELLMGGLGCRMFQSVSNLDKDGGVYATFLKHAYQRTSNNVVEHIAGCFLADHIMKPFESRMESRDQSLLTNETWSTGAKLMNTVATQGHARANKDMAMFLVHYLQFDKAITYMDKAAEQDYPGAAELASKIRELTNKGSSSRKKDKDCVVM